MNPYKISTYGAFLLCLALGVGWGITAVRLHYSESLVDSYVASSLVRQGYVPGKYAKPDIPDAPAGSVPVLVAKGSTRYAPIVVPVHQPGILPVIPPANPPVSPVSCNLDDLNININCSIEAMGQPTKPFARITTWGEVSGFGQIRKLPPTPAGDVELVMAPSVVPPRWRLDFLGGLVIGWSRPGVEVGLAWTGKSRLGGYVMAEYFVPQGQELPWRVHGGIRFRLK